MKKTILEWLLAVFFIATLSGCDSDSCSKSGCDGDTASRVTIMGVATANEPVSGATVSVFKPKGRLIGEFIDETRTNGTFLISVDASDVKDGYRLEISGGVLENSQTPFEDTLRADISKALKDENRVIHTGFASTLMSAFMSRFGEKDHDAAESMVANFLDIPASQGLLTDLHGYSTDFSEAVFASELAAYAGLDEFNAVLLDAYAAGDTHAFPGEPMPEGAMAAAFAEGLISGAGEQIGSRATGWVLDEIFGSSGDPEVPPGDILDAISDVGKEIDALKNELMQFEGRIEKSLQLILTQTERNEYNILVSRIKNKDNTERIKTLQERLKFIIDYKDKTEEDWKKLVVDFEKELNLYELEAILRNFQAVLVGTTDSRSAIDLWGTINTKYALTQQNHQNLFDQFQMYGNLQLATLQLILEKCHKDSPGMSDYYVNLYLYGDGNWDGNESWIGGMKKQSEIFINKVETMMAISQNTRLYPNKFPYSKTDWFAGASGVLYDSATRESPVLAEADNIAANLMALAPALTVRLTYWDIVPDNWIQDVPVTLVNTVTHEEVSPDGTYEYSPEFPLTGHESSSNTAWKQYWYVNRYVFNGLPIGTYRIKDVNAQFPKPYGRQLFLPKYLQYDIVWQDDRQGNMLISAYLLK